MVTVIIFEICALIFCWFAFAYQEWQFPTPYERKHPIYRFLSNTLSNLLGIIVGTAGATILFFVIWCLISMIACDANFCSVTPHLYKTEKITNLADQPNQYVWRRSSKDEVKLIYTTPTDKGYKIRTVDAADAYIQYTNKDDRRAEYYHPEFDNIFCRGFFINMYNDEIILYVPKNTIVTDYNIDLKGD